MTEAACVKKLGWNAVKAAVFDFTRTHFDLPCFEGGPCSFLDENRQCVYDWPELQPNKDYLCSAIDDPIPKENEE